MKFCLIASLAVVAVKGSLDKFKLDFDGFKLDGLADKFDFGSIRDKDKDTKVSKSVDKTCASFAASECTAVSKLLVLHPDEVKCAKGGCSVGQCCDDTCETFTTTPAVGSSCQERLGRDSPDDVCTVIDPADVRCPKDGCTVDMCCMLTCADLGQAGCDAAGTNLLLIGNAPDVICKTDNPLTDGGVCTSTSCCEPSCASFTCEAEDVNTIPKVDAATIPCGEECTLEECCDPVCSGFDCGDGFVFNSPTPGQVRCAGGECSQAECCSQQCSSYTCTSGQQRSMPGMITCPPSGCTDLICCEDTCLTATPPINAAACPSGVGVSMPGATICPSTGCTNEICCFDTCASALVNDVQQTFPCDNSPGGDGVNVPMQGTILCPVGECTALACCDPTCLSAEFTSQACIDAGGTLPTSGLGGRVCPRAGGGCTTEICCDFEELEA
uniref:Uncharacterized protein n=1 Tax=Chromera velia CCMP2878 TaxID=1169474 RepID=A0A0G4I2U6_9ALVE|mmetsp:Transcript_19520/g.39296  ORF Transcript_19520/g.39296 Transcript_19520/m.39296 type:complete len:441 (-) Transcript_19520:570-1892(-)|eukprot:Cvel_10496.t1-p1 / transcript=Cvel_10496.t1 / gene=Cvel_10496 / organism=Chromera_velia_CCMP2878 / gene_product=hypothetical protein / transcript_product=hypothetical protein / location=Cvel_scaffold634:53551-55420(+) / protein_length=440 / sequence_SO=supercontig / SO=protein_coding / is_pseudo=false